jgi:hypothetical protein
MDFLVWDHQVLFPHSRRIAQVPEATPCKRYAYQHIQFENGVVEGAKSTSIFTAGTDLLNVTTSETAFGRAMSISLPCQLDLKTNDFLKWIIVVHINMNQGPKYP